MLFQLVKYGCRGIILLGNFTGLLIGYNYFKHQDDCKKIRISEMKDINNSIRNKMDNSEKSGYYISPNIWISNEVGVLDYYYSNNKRRN